jgi:hypothetical protein
MGTPEDLIEIERSGRRCAICQTGRRWRQFEVVRQDGQQPVVVCAACHKRYGVTPPVATAEQPATAPIAGPDTSSPKKRPAPREDRLRRALRELPHGAHSVGRIAKAAGLNHEKTLNRLHALNSTGEVQQVGKRWSNEPPSTDIEAAMDRLQARTNNLRIVRSREPVG